MSRFVIRGFQILVDLVILSGAYWLAFGLRFEFGLVLDEYKLLVFTWPYVLFLKLGVLTAFGVPSLAWRYIGLREVARIFTALGAATATLVGLRILGPSLGGYFKFVTIPFGVLGADLALSVLGVAGVRVARRWLAERTERKARTCDPSDKKQTLLIGAGRAGVMVAKEVEQNPQMGIQVVGFIDDDPLKIGTVIQGKKILGDSASLAKIAKERCAEQAIITIASASGATIRKIVAMCEKAALPVKIIPGIYEILQGKVGISRIREVTIEDLLGREAVELDLEAIGKFLRGKRVLVTGAGGSIGSELCRQVARFDPEQIILLEQAENPLFDIDNELRREHPNLDAVPVIADVCDSHRVDLVFSRFRPQVVFHAAAHKHVPMMEWNPGEALKNNVFGTKKVADAADRFGAEAFVMISTDKAVNPTSIMGASKRVAEIYVQALARQSKTKFVAVRFGNVLGSAGSVIPTFKEQIRRGGPVTVTHPDMKRYFMTIPEACQLVMEAATMGQGGEIFVLDMGEPVKIADLARDLIRLSGFAEEDIPIIFTGVRPGEKLFEELSTKGENMACTRHPKIYIGRIAEYPYPKVVENLAVIAGVTDATTREEAVAALRTCVPEMCEPEGSRLATPTRPAQPSDTVH
ncbi:MAG: polysaccharide biosynthesis protein [Deltaproteobacteria bacterium]|nr:polysaccharide biosynthesis protein [Deltaproteobacteria bacterium]